MSDAKGQIDNPIDNQPHTPQDNQPSFTIQRIYMKDASLEQPNSPGIFLEAEVAPTIGVDVNVNGETLADNFYEAVVTATVTTQANDKVVFLVEVKQAGIFEIRNVPDEQVDSLLYVAGPTILFPYLRSNISDLVTRAGFPAIHLTDLNFQALYDARRAELAASIETLSGATAPVMTH